MISIKHLSRVFIPLIALIISCAEPEDEKKTEELPARTKPDIPVPDFNADSAYLFIQQQVNFGPRVPNTAAHDSCAEFLIRKLKSYTTHVIVQEAKVTAHDGVVLNIKNIIARFNPEINNRILLCAHWDTRPFADQDKERPNEPFDGANDGASGVGVLLEIARHLSPDLHINYVGEDPTRRGDVGTLHATSLHPDSGHASSLHARGSSSLLRVGVDIILFDAEDYGTSNTRDSYCLGTQYWAENPPIRNYYPKYGILLDMVGAAYATFTMEGYSMQYAPSVVKKVWDTAAKLGYSDYFRYKKTNPMTDDHFYVNTMANIPCINILQYDPSTRSTFGSYWHTHDDNMDIIDKNTLKAVGQTVLEVIYRE